MRRVKVITSNAELEEFLARTDIKVINVDVRSCEQSWFAQEYFTAVIYYDDEPKYEYSPDYWTRLEHQYAGMAMQGMIKTYEQMMRDDIKCKMDCCEHVDAEVANEVLRSHAEACADFCAEFATALVEKLKDDE